MLALFQFLFIGHVHKWIEISRGKLTGNRGAAIGYYYIKECEHCGKVKKFNVL